MIRFIAAGTLALAGAALAASRATTPVRTCPGSLMPAYVHPPQLLALARQPGLPKFVVVNPASGPGPAARGDYRQAIDALRTAGARVLGYVATGWTARPPAVVEADIARYRDWYGVDGIFLDEAAHTEAALPYYAGLAARVGGTVVVNPGVVPARGYFDIADVIVTYEGPVDGYADRVRQMPAWVQALAPSRVAHLVYAASPARARAVLDPPPHAYAYITSGTLPHPWGTLAEERCP